MPARAVTIAAPPFSHDHALTLKAKTCVAVCTQSVAPSALSATPAGALKRAAAPTPLALPAVAAPAKVATAALASATLRMALAPASAM